MASELRISDLFNKFYWELSQKSKLPDSGESTSKQEMLLYTCVVFLQKRFTHTCCTFFPVLGKMYELLGVLAEVHPSDMVNNSDKLYKAYLGELKEQVR